MIWLFLSLIAVLVGSFYAFHLGDSSYRAGSDLISFTGAVCGALSIIGLLIFGGLSLTYYGSSVKAQLINREYGTTYTQQEVFYASDVIDIIRELDRKRYEVNGDLRRQRDPQRDRYQRQAEN